MLHFFSLCAVAVRQAPRVLWRLLALLAILNLLDYVVTVFLFPRFGVSEANGLVALWLQDPAGWPLLALKLLVVLVVGMVAVISYPQIPHLSRWWLFAVNSLLMLGTLWNVAMVLLAVLMPNAPASL